MRPVLLVVLSSLGVLVGGLALAAVGEGASREATRISAAAGASRPAFPESPGMGERPACDWRFESRSTWGPASVHDPCGIAVGGRYYVFSTDVMVGYGTPQRPLPRAGIQIRRSTDLIHWEFVGWVLDGVPAWARERVPGAGGIWAPDIVKVGRGYRLYYAVSRFGMRDSAIGMASAARPEGPWHDEGEVIRSSGGDPQTTANAIDLSVLVDPSGRHWMAYGSFFGGIFLLELDPHTGKPLAPGEGKRIAGSRRGGSEGPLLFYNQRFRKYYLFFSYDFLATTYNVRVARSERPDGPFVDCAGKDLAADPNAGTKILNSYAFAGSEGWLGPGHNGLIHDRTGDYLLHHARHPLCLHVRRIVWTREGWPALSPERYAGEREQALPPGLLPGEWEQIFLAPNNNSKLASARLALQAGGGLETDQGRGAWAFHPPDALTLHWPDGTVAGAQVLAAWDWEKQRPTLVYTGLTSGGIAVWGKRIGPERPAARQEGGKARE